MASKAAQICPPLHHITGLVADEEQDLSAAMTALLVKETKYGLDVVVSLDHAQGIYAIHGGNGAPPMPHVVHDMVEIGRNVDEGASDSPKTSPSARHWREKGRLIVVGAATTATRRRTCFNAEIARLARTSMPWATCRTIHSHVTNALAYVARG